MEGTGGAAPSRYCSSAEELTFHAAERLYIEITTAIIGFIGYWRTSWAAAFTPETDVEEIF